MRVSVTAYFLQGPPITENNPPTHRTHRTHSHNKLNSISYFQKAKNNFQIQTQTQTQTRFTYDTVASHVIVWIVVLQKHQNGSSANRTMPRDLALQRVVWLHITATHIEIL